MYNSWPLLPQLLAIITSNMSSLLFLSFPSRILIIHMLGHSILCYGFCIFSYLSHFYLKMPAFSCIIDVLVSIWADLPDSLKKCYDFCMLSVLQKTGVFNFDIHCYLMFAKELNLVYYHHLHFIYKETEL